MDEFFHEVVSDALEAVDLDASEPASWYLVSLLGDMTKARITDEPLGLKLHQVKEDPGEQIKNLKQVGDTSLYVAGFFSESLSRSLVDVDYYVGIGVNAYSMLARSLSSGQTCPRSLTDVYEELAAKFPQFVDVLATVRKRVDFATPDVTRLYEIWLRTRDEWVEKKLKAAGVLVDAGTKVLQ